MLGGVLLDRLTAWMVQDQSLEIATGHLVIGPTAERRFGRRNFMALYAVFSSPQSYAVLTTAGKRIGTLGQAFVDRLVDEVSCFLLGGRPWVVMRVQHDDRRIIVEPAPRGREPTWGGFLPRFLSEPVCRRIREVLQADDTYSYLTPQSATVLETRRRALRRALSPAQAGIELDDGELRWWTFAGGRINSTLRYALQSLRPGWTVVPDNFVLRIKGAGLTIDAFHAAGAQLSDPKLWRDEALWRRVTLSLPGYRLSKFQPIMPPWVQREVVATYLLDLPGSWRWLESTGS